MKKLVVIMFVVGLIFTAKSALGQNRENCDCSEYLQKTFHLSFGPTYDYRKYGGFTAGASFLNIKTAAYNFNRNFYIGIVSTLKSPIGAEVDFLPTIVFANKNRKDEVEFGYKLGVAYHYDLKIMSNHDNQLSRVVDSSEITKKDKMAICLQLGLNFRVSRFSFYGTWNPGFSWIPKDPNKLSTDDAFVYNSFRFGVSTLIFNKVKKNPMQLQQERYQ
ncbi:MAG: hypothetical protein NT068_00725 [Candidatus Nomurabacteria bacterium]|nr:hypothetical protein [Candidatus Nomurabacteria bacterium]